MHALDFFISEKSNLNPHELFRLRILVNFLCVLGIVPFVIYLGQSLGYCQDEQPILYLILVISCLVTIKLTNNLNYVLVIFLVIGSFIMYKNVMNTGMAISFNIKWFVFLIAFAAIINVRLMLVYCLMLTVVLLSIKSQTTIPNNSLYSFKLIIETFTNHFLFLVSVAVTCYIIFAYISKKNIEEIKKEEQLLEKTKQLLRSNQELERFASIASHDIKSPLRSMINFSVLLEREIGSDLSDKGKYYLQFIKDGSNRLHGLVDDILSYSKVDFAAEDSAQIDVNQVVNDIKTLIHPILLEKQASIIIKNVLPKIEGKLSVMILMLKNLIENGIKYNVSRSPIVFISSNEDGDYYNLEIEDNGIGIDPSNHSQIFEEFQRLHTYDEYQGTGLGLAICKRAMDNIGGEIQIQSIVGIGSKFILKIPKILRKSPPRNGLKKANYNSK